MLLTIIGWTLLVASALALIGGVLGVLFPQYPRQNILAQVLENTVAIYGTVLIAALLGGAGAACLLV